MSSDWQRRFGTIGDNEPYDIKGDDRALIYRHIKFREMGGVTNLLIQRGHWFVSFQMVFTDDTWYSQPAAVTLRRTSFSFGVGIGMETFCKILFYILFYSYLFSLVACHM